MRIYLLLVIVLLLSACSTLDKVALDSFLPINSKEIYTTIIDKKFEIKFNEDGKFIGVKISLSEKIKIDLPGAKNLASSRALAKAKKIISNFIDVSADGVYLLQISETLNIVKDKKNKSKTKDIALVLSEDLKKKKESILKAFYIDRETYFIENKTMSIVAKSSLGYNKMKKKLRDVFE